MVARKRRRGRQRTRSAEPAGGTYLVTGLLLGLLIAAGIYRWRAGQGGTPPPDPARSGGPVTHAPGDEPAREDVEDADEDAVAASEPRFQFYDMLPSFEVVIPEERERVAAPPTATRPLERPGVYILQAGSYRAHADADRARAQLALLGVTAQIQRVVVGETEYHRVRVGPLSDLARVNELRDRLRQNHIEAIVIRVGE